ncbi:MAG: carbohydrate kinase [Eubacteriales bacterium]|nr:carbohydrate kinase [Eubacteriales bacterium]
MAILGLDIGTTGCKATLFSEKGLVIGYAYQEYPIESPQKGWFELNPATVWQAVRAVIRKSRTENGAEITCVCTSSLGEAFVNLDENGAELCGSILYLDERGQQECNEITNTLGAANIMQSTGHAPSGMYSLSKLLWLKHHQPETYRNTRWLHFFGDYILYKLTGEHVTDYSLAARSMCFDIAKKQWDSKILGAFELDEAIFPAVRVAGSVVGRVRRDAALETGLSTNTLAVLGAHDQIMCALGAGALACGEAVNSIGTVDCVTPVFSGAILTQEMMRRGYACVPYLLENTYVTYAFSMTGGSLLRWFRDTFARLDAAQAERDGRQIYTLLEESMPEEPTTLITLPHFAGSPIPNRDAQAKGAILNLSFDTRREDIYRSCMEGETFEMRNNLEYVKRNGISINALRTVGGGSRSEKFMQIRADILGVPILTMECAEAGTLGTGILAGTSTGIFSSLQEACESLVRVKKVFEPNAGNRDFYQSQFEKYMSLYERLKAVR